MFGFVAKHRGVWPVSWMCDALGVSRSGFFAWLSRSPSARAKADDAIAARVRASYLQSDRTYGARRVWRDVLAEGVACGLHRIEKLMRLQAFRARPRRRRLPSDTGVRGTAAVAPNTLDRRLEATAPNRKWVAALNCAMRCERRSPPFGSARRASLSRNARAQRTAVDTAKPKRWAAAFRRIQGRSGIAPRGALQSRDHALEVYPPIVEIWMK